MSKCRATQQYGRKIFVNILLSLSNCIGAKVTLRLFVENGGGEMSHSGTMDSAHSHFYNDIILLHVSSWVGRIYANETPGMEHKNSPLLHLLSPKNATLNFE